MFKAAGKQDKGKLEAHSQVSDKRNQIIEPTLANSSNSRIISQDSISQLVKLFSDKQLKCLANASKSSLPNMTETELELVNMTLAAPNSIELPNRKLLYTLEDMLLLLNALPYEKTTNNSKITAFNIEAMTAAIIQRFSSQNLIRLIKAVLSNEVYKDKIVDGAADEAPTLFRNNSVGYTLLLKIIQLDPNHHTVNDFIVTIFRNTKGKNDLEKTNHFLSLLSGQQQNFPTIQAFILCMLYNELILQGVSKKGAAHCKVKGFLNNRFLSGALFKYFGDPKTKEAEKNLPPISSILTFTKELSNFTSPERNQIWFNICTFFCEGRPLAECEKNALDVIAKSKSSPEVGLHEGTNAEQAQESVSIVCKSVPARRASESTIGIFLESTPSQSNQRPVARLPEGAVAPPDEVIREPRNPGDKTNLDNMHQRVLHNNSRPRVVSLASPADAQSFFTPSTSNPSDSPIAKPAAARAKP